MRILFIAYVDLDGGTSGSSVRPTKMLKAFQDEGHEMIVLSGAQTGKDRNQRIQDVLRKINKSKPDLCYIESPVYPIMRHADRMLIKTIHEMGIPIGYFYRDFYRKFPEEFPRRSDFAGRIKDFGLDVLQVLTDRCITNCDIVYVPSKEAAHFFQYKDIRALPPAGENHFVDNRKPNHIAVYVGGIINHYDGKLLLDVFGELHKRDSSYQLILVCRPKEWESFDHHYKNAKWLHVYHSSGDELREHFLRASVALVIGNKQYTYNEFGISVKIFEYLSYGLPQIAVNGKAVENMFQNEKIGIAVEPAVEPFADAIERIVNNQQLYDEYQKNIKTSLLEKNLWVHRVRQVISELLPAETNNRN